MNKYALISVYRKEKIEIIAKKLSDLGFKLICSDGTSKYLYDFGIKTERINSITGFPEILGGRVKTLHPKIHGGLLAKRDIQEHTDTMQEHGIPDIQVVVSNLYPFEETVNRAGVSYDEVIENIDIGGPTIIRAAAKNSKYLTVLIDPVDYDAVLAELEDGGEVSKSTRNYLAAKAFNYICRYDSLIADYFQAMVPDYRPEYANYSFAGIKELRYGENPHQKAYWAGDTSGIFENLKENPPLSYNNLIDVGAAIRLIHDFKEPAVGIFKHTNPCGVAIGEDICEAYVKAFATDTISPYGGIIVTNGKVTQDFVNLFKKVFTEIIIAPDYDDEVLQKLKKRKKLKILRYFPEKPLTKVEIKSFEGAVMVQESDLHDIAAEEYKVVTKRQPDENELANLKFGWKAAKHAKSNAMVLVRDFGTIGIGNGQTSRFDAFKLAIMKANDNKLSVEGTVLASDGFIPFADSIEYAAKHGIKAIIQPGGSIRDEEVIEACDKYGIAMVFTGRRHFKH